jgi:rhodanese-related sulfurtransferase
MKALSMRTILAVAFWVWAAVVLTGCLTVDERILEPQAALELIEESKGRPDFMILDVRTPGEFRRGIIEGAILMDYYAPDFSERFAALDRDATIFVYCHSGGRSSDVLRLADKLGFKRVFDLRGGIVAWARQGLPLVAGRMNPMTLSALPSP